MHDGNVAVRLRAVVGLAGIALAVASPAFAWQPPNRAASPATNAAGPPTHIRFRGKDMEVYPPALLRVRGLTAPDIPADANAAWAYVDAINQMVDVPPELDEAFQAAAGGMWPEGETAQRLGAFLDQNRAAMDRTIDATKMPRYYMPLFRGESDALIAALLPSLGPQRQLARLFAADAARRLAAGDAEAALRDSLTIQRVGHQIGICNTLIEGLVGLSVSSLAEQSIVQAAQSGRADASSLETAMAEMDALAATFPSWDQMIRAEQRWASTTVDDLMNGTSGVSVVFTGEMFDSAGAAPERDSTPTGWTRLGARMKRLFLPDRAISRHMKNFYNGIIASTHHDDGAVGLPNGIEQQLLDRVPAWDVMSRTILPALGRSYEMSLRARSNFVRARLALATAAYQTVNGSPPPSAGALVPRFMPEVPIDPMTGHLLELQAPTSHAPLGVSIITNEMESNLRAERSRPPVGIVRATRWRQYAEAFANRYELIPAQRASVDAIVRDLEKRAEAIEAGREKGKAAGGAAREGEQAKRNEALAGLFQELKSRLQGVPTVEQKAASRPAG